MRAPLLYTLASPPPLPFALRIVSHTRNGVAGMSIASTPSGRSAPITALTMAGALNDAEATAFKTRRDRLAWGDRVPPGRRPEARRRGRSG